MKVATRAVEKACTIRSVDAVVSTHGISSIWISLTIIHMSSTLGVERRSLGRRVALVARLYQVELLMAANVAAPVKGNVNVSGENFFWS